MNCEFSNDYSRDGLSNRAFTLLAHTAAVLASDKYQIICSPEAAEIHRSRDVHAYFPLNPGIVPVALGSTAVNNLLLHVQAYPGMSNDQHMAYIARFMDKQKRDQAREIANVGIGNEHSAVVAHLTESGNPEMNTMDWSAVDLANTINSKVQRTI